MELFFLVLLIALMALALGSGYPVAFALPGSAIITILLAAASGYVFTGNPDAFFFQGGPGQWLSAGVTNLRGVYWEPERDTLIAIPLFIFMGIMLQRSKIAEDLLITMAQIFGPVPGGLGISVVFVGALLAATTGIVGATVVAMGLISLPAMLQNKYSRPLASGTIAASGTLGQIIPPSIVLIILADQLASSADQAGSVRKALYKSATGELSMPSVFDITSASAGEMFLGAFVPGMLLVALYMAFILVYAFFKPEVAPAVHYDGRFDRRFLLKVFLTLVPPLALIFMVLGSIIAGVATVNQAGAIGAAGALVMSGYRLREGHRGAYWPAIIAIISLVCISFIVTNFDTNIKSIKNTRDLAGVWMAFIAVAALIISLIWSGWRAFKIEDTLRGVMVETAKATSLVFIILLGAAMLTAAFRAFGGEDLVREFLNGLPGGFWSKFAIVMAVIFFLGFFLDFIEIAVVVVPIVAPILLADPSANITAVWLGVMIGLNIQTSFLTPPFGFALFYLRGVAPAIVRTIEIYKGVIPFIALQIFALIIVGLTPQLVNYLPNRVAFLSETAPPPRNPKLQYCLEEYVTERFLEDGSKTIDAILAARALDLTNFPKNLVKPISASFDKAVEATKFLQQSKDAENIVLQHSVIYRPIHSLVRDIESEIRDLKIILAEKKTAVSRMHESSDDARKSIIKQQMAELEVEVAKLTSKIPADWATTNKTFTKLTKAEDKLRLQYRRAADASYEPIAQAVAMLTATNDLKKLAGDIGGIRAIVTDADVKKAAKELKRLERLFGSIAGASPIKKELGKARRALTAKKPKPKKALKAVDKALETYSADIGWRSLIAPSVIADFVAYEAILKETLGIRKQRKMNREQALYVAACNSGHKDISLNF